MNVRSYQQYENGVEINYTNGKNHFVWYTQDTGKVIGRKKVNTLAGINHEGIVLGVDDYNNTIAAHYH